MLDIDFMVLGKSLQKAEELLKKEGYSSKPGKKYIQHKNPVHLPRLKATDKTASIEIHLVAVELKSRDELTSAQIWMGKQYITDFGLEAGTWTGTLSYSLNLAKRSKKWQTFLNCFLSNAHLSENSQSLQYMAP